jgi:tRNA (mo5U34)-methyltransferase
LIVPEDGYLAAAVAGRDWYHTLELADDTVTPGWFDTRVVSRMLPWPDLSRKRCLDIGTFDGFWAFEMERRGAADVVALDILDDSRWDWPLISRPEARTAIARRKGGGDGFLIASEALGSSVQRVDGSIYELSADEHGSFDFVYLGSLLLHLRDPIGALEKVRSVCEGTLLAVDGIDLPLTVFQPLRPATYLEAKGRPYWHRPNLAGFRRMVRAAGFDVTRGPRPFLMPTGDGFDHPPRKIASIRTREGREATIASLFGDPHAWLLAKRRER